MLSQARQHTTPLLNVDKVCFPEQAAFIRDPARFKTALCSRRAGKSIGCAFDLSETCLSTAGIATLYITQTRVQAKRIIWGPLKEINREHRLGGEPHETDLSMRFRNDSVIYLAGASDATEISKYLGFPIKKVYIDEAQSFKPYIEELIDEVLGPTLYDYNGMVCATGTPGPVPVGFFHKITNSKEWSNHHWTMFQNPWIQKKSGKTPMQLVLEDCKRMGIDINHPKIQRHCFGRWVIDSDSLVFHWEAFNDYNELPNSPEWSYVVGVDLGYDDADAISVIGWPKHTADCYLIEEVVVKKQGITELAQMIGRVIKTYDPLSCVMDTGGLGKKIAEELRKRYSLPIKAAEKSRKFEYIELLNDALRTKRFRSKALSQFTLDSQLLEWDKDKSNGDKLVVSDKFHSDICDATLYAYRESLHWLEEPEVEKPKYGSTEYWQKETERMEEELADQLGRDDSDPANWSYE